VATATVEGRTQGRNRAVAVAAVAVVGRLLHLRPFLLLRRRHLMVNLARGPAFMKAAFPTTIATFLILRARAAPCDALLL